MSVKQCCVSVIGLCYTVHVTAFCLGGRFFRTRCIIQTKHPKILFQSDPLPVELSVSDIRGLLWPNGQSKATGGSSFEATTFPPPTKKFPKIPRTEKGFGVGVSS